MAAWLRSVRLRARGKRELRRLPLDEWAEEGFKSWLRRYWSLPPEAWPKAVDLRLEERVLREHPSSQALEALEKLRTPLIFPAFGRTNYDEERDRLQKEKDALWAGYEERFQVFWGTRLSSEPVSEPKPQEPQPRLTPEQQAAMAAKALRYSELAVQSIEQCLQSITPTEFAKAAEEFSLVAGRINQSAENFPLEAIPLGEPWEAWISRLPAETQAEGRHACAVWIEMIHLHGRLQATLKEHHELSVILEAEAKRVNQVRMFELRSRIAKCDRYYREIAEPFFARHGRPPLEGAQASTIPRPPIGERRERPAIDVNEAWQTWLQRVPNEDQEAAVTLRERFLELMALRWRLLEAIDRVGRSASNGPDEVIQAQERVENLSTELDRADAEYRRLSQPLFARYGEPNLRGADAVAR